MDVTDETAAKPAREAPYHHGDLRNALVRASAQLAEIGGPAAVTVRAAARAVGVTATAAYRHFSGHEELLAAVHEQAEAALFEALANSMNGVADQGDPTTTAIARLATAGRAYIEYAVRERGLFRTAFCGSDIDAHLDKDVFEDPIFQLIGVGLDALVAVGYMDPRQRPGAEFTAWAAIHGLATLLVDGPLVDAEATDREAAIQHAIATVLRGFATGPRSEPYRSTDPNIALPA
ncbi:TetR-like C-terminal domain-containing protein [Nocardia sp. CDC160]|uniref:TetR-like C-terminal domain-containing protein n=1 Tax=Nocardia sp. CDC160 TaxID=3112166 RepID=UPI002DB8155A|nr:TetR-like C-terminal domain-containing protein [Nocardia sp. CDC160]MEC3914952.1 TetR-like C-terminal domain-containing protein [Nocardia sp. CDC160]